MTPPRKVKSKKSQGKVRRVPRMIHIGKKVPKGFEELQGGIHLGKGIWMLPMAPLPKRGKKEKRR